MPSRGHVNPRRGISVSSRWAGVPNAAPALGWRRWGPSASVKMIALTIYTRPGCHLCDDMKATIKRVAQALPEPLTLEEIDISSDPDLEQCYGEQIPILLLGGKKIAKYRIAEGDLARFLNHEAVD